MNMNLDILFSAEKLLLKIGLEKVFMILQMIVHLDPEKNQPTRGAFDTEVGDQIHSVVTVITVWKIPRAQLASSFQGFPWCKNMTEVDIHPGITMLN